MTLSITNGLIALAVFVAFLFIARRVFRLALKLALVGALFAVFCRCRRGLVARMV